MFTIARVMFRDFASVFMISSDDEQIIFILYRDVIVLLIPEYSMRVSVIMLVPLRKASRARLTALCENVRE